MYDFIDALRNVRRCLMRQGGHLLQLASLPSLAIVACSLALPASHDDRCYGEGISPNRLSNSIAQLSQDAPSLTHDLVSADIDRDSGSHRIPIEFEQAQLTSGIAFELDPIVDVAQNVEFTQNVAGTRSQEFRPAPLPRPLFEDGVEVERNAEPLVVPMRNQLESGLTEHLFPESTIPQVGDSYRQEGVASTTSQFVRPWLDIRPRTLDQVAPALVPVDQLPPDRSGMADQDTTAHWVQLYQTDLLLNDIWPGASFCHRPLYFQDSQLERCGTIPGPLHHCPSVHSAIHFAWKTGILPANVAYRPPCRYVRSGCK